MPEGPLAGVFKDAFFGGKVELPATKDPRFRHLKADNHPLLMLRHYPQWVRGYFSARSETGLECDIRCGEMPFFRADDDDVWSIAALLAAHVLLWIGLWYAGAAIAKAFLMHRLPPSSVERENSAWYVGQKLASTLKVLLVSAFAHAAILTPPQDLYSLASPVAMCGDHYADMAGTTFTCFEIADLLLLAVHGLLDVEFFIHHTIHISIGLLIRSVCQYGFHAGVLMTQETSGIFLNGFLLMRNRTPGHGAVNGAFVAFALAFFAYRLLLGTAGAWHFWLLRRTWMPQGTLLWPADLVAVLQLVASVLQWYWGFVILRKVLRTLRGGNGKPKGKPKEA